MVKKISTVAISAEQWRLLSRLIAGHSVCVCERVYIFRETLRGDCVDSKKALSAVSVHVRPLSLAGTITAVVYSGGTVEINTSSCIVKNDAAS